MLHNPRKHAWMMCATPRHELTAKLIEGIPHALIMSNEQDEKQLLVPVTYPRRPLVGSQPFSTELVMNRSNKAFYAALTQRYFLYPVHLSLSFLMPKGVSSALYLLLLRFLSRNYEAAFRLTDSIATDTPYSEEGRVIFAALSEAVDCHPAAHAIRIKISLVTIDAVDQSFGSMPLPWDLTQECARAVGKYAHISASCHIPAGDELQLLENKLIVTDHDCTYYRANTHTDYLMTLVFNRREYLREVQKHRGRDFTPMQVSVTCRSPHRNMTSAWPFYTDHTVLGTKYDDVVQVRKPY